MPESSAQLQRGATHTPKGDAYQLRDGVFVRDHPVTHDSEQYDARGYRVLSEMQRRHFWHRGRHRFLAEAVRRQLSLHERTGIRVIDLGAGCGGWMQHVSGASLFPDSELALGDSSLIALNSARDLVGSRVSCFQIDLMDLAFDQRWDVMFLLDVLEHLDDDVGALRSVYRALAPGGLLFVTVPALRAFWSWNDEIVKHKRRYDTATLQAAAESAGLSTVDQRYFMFLLSPLLLLSRRLKQPNLAELDADQQWQLIQETHRVPAVPVNVTLAGLFALETPLGHWLKFPWGTSLLGVFRKPA